MQTQINWESFSVYNQDARGIRYKFEDLCRQLFTNENLSKKEKKYLHVNPNNAGLEADPIYDEKTKCWIGFQVKYFDNNVDYDQIKHSAEKIIEYYAGRVDRDRQLLEGDVLTVFGDPGTGKSQLLAHKTQQLIDAGRASLLLVAGIYFTAEPIHEQIMKNLRLDFSFEDLIDILEAIGEKDDCIIPIFIDALNETWNNRLWKSGLPAIIEKVKQSAMVKLVLTYRPEYEKQLIPDSVLQQMKTGDVVTLCHRGFADNSIDAVRSFLNHFNIPFTPLEYFSYEMSKPLFLLLYCKTYNGEEVSLPALYERLIEHANINIYKSMKDALINNGYSESYSRS